MSFEDGHDTLVLELVEAIVDVVEGGSEPGVLVDVGIDRQAVQTSRLLAHLHDDAAQPRRERGGAVDAAGALGDVDAQVRRTLDVAVGPQRGDDRPQVDGHGLLECEHAVALLFERHRHLVDLVVLVDDLLGTDEVEIEEGPR